MSGIEDPARRRRSEQGLGLVELLAATAVGLLVALSAFASLALSLQAAAVVKDLSQLQQQAAYAMHLMGGHLRQAGANDAVRDGQSGRYAFGPRSPLAGSGGAAIFGTDGKGKAADSISVAFTPAQLSTRTPAPRQSWQYDCSGSRVDGLEQVSTTFEVNGQAQLVCAGVTRQPVITNVADLRLRYRVDTGAGIRMMNARTVDSLKLWAAVQAVEVCLHLQGDEKLPDRGLAFTNCEGEEKPRNGRVHLVMRNLFSLRPR
jgi:type IV pilus assembly protein PilW